MRVDDKDDFWRLKLEVETAVGHCDSKSTRKAMWKMLAFLSYIVEEIELDKEEERAKEIQDQEEA